MIIVGCRFHLRQAWYRQIQYVGLQKTYQKTKSTTRQIVISEGGKWLQYVFGLTFLRPDKVKDAFMSELLPLKPTSNNFKKFTEYTLSNYVDDDAKYPSIIWASHTASLERTTNMCESFHSRFNASSNNTHPDIFSFTNKLVEFQTDTYVNIQSLNIPKKIRNTYAASKSYRRRPHDSAGGQSNK